MHTNSNSENSNQKIVPLTREELDKLTGKNLFPEKFAKAKKMFLKIPGFVPIQDEQINVIISH